MKWPIRLLILLAPAAFTEATSRVILGHRGPITEIAVVGDTVFSCSQAGINARSGKATHSFGRMPFRVLSFAPSGDGDTLVLAGGEPGESGSLALLDRESRELIAAKTIADDLVYSVAVSGEAGFFALADGRVLEVDLATLGDTAKLHHQHTAPARSVCLAPNGRFLASGGMDRLVIVSDRERRSDRVTIQDHTGPVDRVVFSPDSTRIASGSRDGKVRVHAVPGGKLIRTYGNLAGEVGALAWGGKPERLVAGTNRGRIYDLELSDDSISVLRDGGEDRPVASLAIDPAGRIFVGVRHRVEEIDSTTASDR